MALRVEIQAESHEYKPEMFVAFTDIVEINKNNSTRNNR